MQQPDERVLFLGSSCGHHKTGVPYTGTGNHFLIQALAQVNHPLPDPDLVVLPNTLNFSVKLTDAGRTEYLCHFLQTAIPVAEQQTWVEHAQRWLSRIREFPPDAPVMSKLRSLIGSVTDGKLGGVGPIFGLASFLPDRLYEWVWPQATELLGVYYLTRSLDVWFGHKPTTPPTDPPHLKSNALVQPNCPTNYYHLAGPQSGTNDTAVGKALNLIGKTFAPETVVLRTACGFALPLPTTAFREYLHHFVATCFTPTERSELLQQATDWIAHVRPVSSTEPCDDGAARRTRRLIGHLVGQQLGCVGFIQGLSAFDPSQRYEFVWPTARELLGLYLYNGNRHFVLGDSEPHGHGN